MQQLSAQDAQFLYLESPNNLTHVTGLTIYDPSTAPGGKVRFKDIIHHIESRLHASPLFRRRLVHVPFELDFPYWVDDEYFDIEYHTRHGRLPEPGDWRQLCIHLARYHSRPLDMQRPPWELFVIEGLDNVQGLPKGCYAIATKIHHAAVDGASAVKFFGALSDIDPKGTPLFGLPRMAIRSGREPGLAEMLGRAALHGIKSPLRITDTVLRSAPSVYRAAQHALSAQPSSRRGVPQTRFNQALSPHKMFDGTIFALADFKAIKNAVEGATINDVVLAVVSGGLRRYLQSHNELPEASLVAWVPINARPKNETADGAENTSNNITAMTAPLHTDIEDPLKRLAAIQSTTSESKEAKSGISARLMTDLSQHVPAATQAMASRMVLRAGLANRICNLFISNVPGPQVELYMNGARILYQFGMAPLADGMGLFIATPSYNGTITFGVTSTREVLPDIRFFVTCLEESLDELKHAVAPKKKPAPRKKRAK